MNIHNLFLPAKIQNQKGPTAEGGRDSFQTSQFVSGVAGVFAGQEAVNFLPFEFRSRRFEAFQRKILLLLTVGLTGFFAMSFFFVKLQTAYYAQYVAMDERHLKTLGNFAELSSKAFPRHFLVSEIERGTVPAEKVLKLLGYLLPEQMVIKKFFLDAALKRVVLEVAIELSRIQSAEVVDDFVSRLRGTSFFDKVSSSPVFGESEALSRIEGVFKDD